VIRARSDLKRVQRLVVKIGSSLLADARTGVRQARLDALADVIAALRERGVEVAIVSSGAVALGCVHLGWVGRALRVHEKQAAAAIGQPMLMQAWRQAFDRHGIGVAQLLITRDDLRNRRRYLNASNTSETLFSAGIVPVVNENDTVVVREIKFGDNDNLGALAALLMDADLLVMMTDVDGLHSANPARNAAARRIGVVETVTPELLAAAGGAGSSFGTGGMASKLKAARIATRGGVAAAIVDGRRAASLRELLAGRDVGTLFPCGADRQSRRRHWIAEVLPVSGRIIIDDGARSAILGRGASLLPVGVVSVEGMFDKGECVEIVGTDGGLVGRGLPNYDAEELRRIVGVSSDRIEEVLGFRDFSSVIHRDNLVIMGGAITVERRGAIEATKTTGA